MKNDAILYGVCIAPGLSPTMRVNLQKMWVSKILPVKGNVISPVLLVLSETI